MDPIRKKTTPNTPAPAGPSGPGPIETPQADRKFDVGANPVGPGQTSAAGGAQNVIRPDFDRISAQIRESAGKSLTREQVRDQLIDSETKRIFGDHATPQMSAAVSEAFQNDPHLSQLFNQLFSKATKGA